MTTEGLMQLPRGGPLIAGSPPASRQRLLFIDNLRWTVIILVISMHAADTYSPLGNWYYVERPPVGLATLLTFAIWQMYLQAFFMGLLFFASGVFVPASLDRKGASAFLRDRAFRLGLPVLFYMFVLGPVTEYYVAHSWSAPYSFAHEWWRHIIDGQVLSENGPLWFCLALLIFDAAYVAIHRRGVRQQQRGNEEVPGTATVIGFALLMATGRFVIRGVLPNAVVLNMHLGDFSQYILLFAAGTIAARGRWLERLPASQATRWTAVVLPVGFAVWFFTLWSGRQPDGSFIVHSDGWYAQSATLSLWESFTCVAICLGVLVWYRKAFNTQGRVARFLSANAFSVYVFHPPIVILGARLLHLVPELPLWKFIELTAFATIATFVLSSVLFRRIPLLRAIL